MTIVLYDYCQLQEKASRHLNVWKAWHLVLYALAAVCGIVNYVLLQNTMQMVDDNCVLFPRQLAFRMTDVPESVENITKLSNVSIGNVNQSIAAHFDNVEDNADNVRRDIAAANETQSSNETNPSNVDENTVVGYESRLVLDTSRTLFAHDNDCQFAEYMPIVSLIFAATWATFFTMCPGGGHSRSGLQQPWRILAPALIFALVMVGLTGHSFTRTNVGLRKFCAAFYNVTNTTTCTSVEPYLYASYQTSWGFSWRAAGARAASAAAWASWAAAAALLLARCLAAPDFQVQRTTAHLKDPKHVNNPIFEEIAPTTVSRFTKIHDDASIRSEPTITTELVTVSIEPGQDTAPASLQGTPVKHRPGENIEMTTSP